MAQRIAPAGRPRDGQALHGSDVRHDDAGGRKPSELHLQDEFCRHGRLADPQGHARQARGGRLKNLQESGAQLIACQMSMDVMGIRREEMIDGVELGGVAAFLDEAHQSAVTLFI